MALEICLAGESTLACFDGATFAEQWRVTLPSAAKSLQIAEIDGDLYPEVLVGTKDYFVFAFDGETGWLKWRTPNLSLWGSGFDLLRIVDLDGGFPLEVVAAASGSNDGQLTTFASDTGLTSAGPWSLPLNSLMPAAREDSPTLLLAGNNAGQVYPVDPLTGVAGAQIASFSSPVESFGLADFNRDGTLDVAALHRNRFEVHDGATGLPLGRAPTSATYSTRMTVFSSAISTATASQRFSSPRGPAWPCSNRRSSPFSPMASSRAIHRTGRGAS